MCILFPLTKNTKLCKSKYLGKLALVLLGGGWGRIINHDPTCVVHPLIHENSLTKLTSSPHVHAHTRADCCNLKQHNIFIVAGCICHRLLEGNSLLYSGCVCAYVVIFDLPFEVFRVHKVARVQCLSLVYNSVSSV